MPLLNSRDLRARQRAVLAGEVGHSEGVLYLCLPLDAIPIYRLGLNKFLTKGHILKNNLIPFKITRDVGLVNGQMRFPDTHSSKMARDTPTFRPGDIRRNPAIFAQMHYGAVPVLGYQRPEVAVGEPRTGMMRGCLSLVAPDTLGV